MAIKTYKPTSPARRSYTTASFEEITTNKPEKSLLATKKKNWIDFDASPLLEGKDMDSLSEKFLDYIIGVASGEETKNEKNGYREISIFKDGIVL